MKKGEKPSFSYRNQHQRNPSKSETTAATVVTQSSQIRIMQYISQTRIRYLRLLVAEMKHYEKVNSCSYHFCFALAEETLP